MRFFQGNVFCRGNFSLRNRNVPLLFEARRRRRAFGSPCTPSRAFPKMYQNVKGVSFDSRYRDCRVRGDIKHLCSESAATERCDGTNQDPACAPENVTHIMAYARFYANYISPCRGRRNARKATLPWSAAECDPLTVRYEALQTCNMFIIQCYRSVGIMQSKTHDFTVVFL